jgi:nucleoside-diphosphate-sugar epimerase
MKVLVSGGGGFLGAELVASLSKNGYEVKSLGRSFSSLIDCEQNIADIMRPDSYVRFLSTWKPEVVIQTAWVTDQKTYRSSSLNSDYMNATLEFAKQSYLAGAQHFLGLGSSAEYGNPTKPCNALNTPAAPRDAYGMFKLQTLEKLRETAEKFSGRFSWARIFQPYGPNQDPMRLLPLAAKELRAKKSFEVANPNVILDWVSSRDVASAITYSIKNPMNQIFDIGTSQPISVMQALRSLVKILDVNPELLKFEGASPNEDGQLLLVVSKESPLFTSKWSPQDDLISGLKWTFSP